MTEPSFDRHEDSVMGLGIVDDPWVSGVGKGKVMESHDRISRVVENGHNDGEKDMCLNGLVSGSGVVDGGDIGANLVESRSDKNHKIVSKVGELPAINLVVDLSHCSRKESDHNGVELNKKQANNVEITKKEDQYEFSDLVWAKVKNHPWWPGQIIDPSVSTNKAMKHFKKDGFLIAYFGDQTFGFHESSNIKPFRLNFCKMANQGKGEAFIHAVNHALHEAARRVEFALACSCLSKDAFVKIKSQIIVNAGVRKEFSIVDGGDRFSTVDSFKPAKFVDFMENLARDPFGINRLEVSTVRGQLSAFNRWKGYHQLGLNEYKSDNMFDDDNYVLHSKGKSNACGGSRKHLFDGGLNSSKKERSLLDLMSNGNSNVSDGEHKPKRRGRKRKVIESDGSSGGIQSQTPAAFLSQICRAARNPMKEEPNLAMVKFLSDFRNHRLREDMNDDETVNQPETVETDGFTGIKDSYWTDRIIVTKSDFSPKSIKENSATALILKFTNLDSVPSIKKLNEIFRRYGALQEAETRVLEKKKCVKVVFERRCDAETAFSSSGKFSIFGPALTSYCLNYKPTPRKMDAPAKNGVNSARALQFEN